jgi:hypothetical protein
VAAFLRVINALENIRQSVELLRRPVPDLFPAGLMSEDRVHETLGVVAKETDDAIQVLAGGGLHPRAVGLLRAARRLTGEVVTAYYFQRSNLVRRAIILLASARDELIAVPREQ